MTERNPTFRSGRMRVDFDRIETRAVLCGAYRGGDLRSRNLLTHLVFIDAEGELRTGCSMSIDNIVDRYGMREDELRARPTCPACATKYDKILAEFGESVLPALMPNRAPHPHHGRADQLTRRVYWQESGEGDWTNVTLGLRDVEDAAYLGPINIEDTPHAVFRLADGRTVAQVTDMARNYDYSRPFGGARPPAPKFELGDAVRDIDTGATGKVSFIGQYDELIGGWRYRVLEPDGTRKFWNETKMVLSGEPMHRNHKGLLRYNAPPPPPRRRRSVDPSLQRVRQITEEHERREKPFDPSIGYERETKSHHFALNPGELKPFRLPDEEFDLRWAVWYGPDGVDGDVATEVEVDGLSGIIVREYQNVDGLIEEYDESEPFLVHEVYLSGSDIEQVAFGNTELYDAMNESEDPDAAELTLAPEEDEPRLLILRYAAAIGVRYLSERGGEESWAAELPR